MCRYKLESGLNETDIRNTITARALEYGAVYKTILSQDDTRDLMQFASVRNGGKMFKELMRVGDGGTGVASDWLGRRVKGVWWEAGLCRLRLFHD